MSTQALIAHSLYSSEQMLQNAVSQITLMHLATSLFIFSFWINISRNLLSTHSVEGSTGQSNAGDNQRTQDVEDEKHAYLGVRFMPLLGGSALRYAQLLSAYSSPIASTN